MKIILGDDIFDIEDLEITNSTNATMIRISGELVFDNMNSESDCNFKDNLFIFLIF